MSNNQKTLLLIESFILSGPMLLFVYFGLYISIIISRGWNQYSTYYLSLCTIFVLIVLLPNILFFSVLRNKLNMEIETFLYGIGFLSNIAILGFF
jgi:pilus assembly protein TadC